MKASYNWLRSLVPDLDASPSEMAERLTRAGLEVEDLVEFGAASPAVVVAEVTAVERHPDRDRLTLVTVDRGGAKQTVVCGAPNVPAPGGRVVLAPLGTVLPVVGLTVAPRPIGGITSEGMLCSENELGLVSGGGKGEGILILDASDGAPGTPLSEAVRGSHDWTLDIGVTPNRPDALSHVGIARDLATLFEVPLRVPAAEESIDGEVDIAEICRIDIDDTERCPHYGGAVVLGVEVAPSPRWARYRLESLGIRAISNVVDATNLLLLETGHPTHAFDLDRLPGGRVLVRRAKQGEPIITLDGVERVLTDDDLLITDGDRPIALAGVMGGENTEISDEATKVLLECAYFAPRGIRRTSRRHGLHSEASHRFERGCDPRALPHVLSRGVQLITELCGGQTARGTILAGVEPAPRPRVRLRRRKMVSLLGLDVTIARAEDILGRLGCEVSPGAGAEELSVTPPSFRPDLGREEDLIEEVMRIEGLDGVPVTHRAVPPVAGRSKPSTEERARREAAALGLAEALTYGFVAPRDLEALSAPAATVILKNPLSEERSVMRTSLLPGLLEALRRARRHGVQDVRLFTVGRLFLAPAEDSALPHEQDAFAAVLAGSRQNGLERPQPIDVYDAKGVACALLERVTGKTPVVEAAGDAIAHLHPRAAASLRIDGQLVGRFGQLHPEVVDRFDLDGAALVVEIDLDAVARAGWKTPQFRPVPVLPPVSRDLALLVSEEVTAGALAAHIGEVAGDLCESVELFDRFTGKGIEPGQQSLAFHLLFRDPKAASAPEEARTLTDQEVDQLTGQVIASLGDRFGATVRGA